MSTADDRPDPILRTEFCGLEFASPIVLLSGCVGFGEEYTRVEGFSNTHVGGIALKGTTGEARLVADVSQEPDYVAGVSAAVLHLFNHALMKAALFMAMGCFFYRLRSSRLEDLAGVGRRMPWTFGAFAVGSLSVLTMIW